MTYLLPNPPTPSWNKPAIIIHMDEEKPVKKAVKKAPAKKAPAKRAAKKPPPVKEPEVYTEISAAEVIESGVEERVLLFMERGASYSTPSGVLFNKAHPFQLVDNFEAKTLLEMPEDRFRLAKPQEAKDYYSK